uniref:Uncharacterized protein n=1 Tax=Ditylenchus dipsaci TaxID=166011 RepID=A0A915EQG2_9BILA
MLVFNDLRVTANLNVADNNTVYAVCRQDCSMGDINCLRQGENCTNEALECPKYTSPAGSSATSSYKLFIFSLLPIFLLSIVV